MAARIFIDGETLTYGDAHAVRFVDMPDAPEDWGSNEDIMDMIDDTNDPATVEDMLAVIRQNGGEAEESGALSLLSMLRRNGYIA